MIWPDSLKTTEGITLTFLKITPQNLVTEAYLKNEIDKQ